MLMGRVARMYYEHGLTHQEIANALGLSRIRVTRLLQEARATGVVEIVVHVDESLFADDEHRLAERYGLNQVWISPSVGDADKADRAFASVGAEALGTVLDTDMTVALGLSTAVAQVVSAVPRSTTGGTFVPIGGSSSGPAQASNPHELALRLASATGGRAFHLPAPLVSATAEAAALAYSDPAVADVLTLAAGADLLVAGVGGTGRDEGILLGSLPASTRDELIAAHAVGDLAGRFFDAEGRHVTSPLDDRIIALDLDQLRGIPRRLGIARGASKVVPLRAALASGLLTMLVTDSATAEALLG
ncbi:sugar-binding transcriptional regulator [Frigoribacterium sp. 2-23]|uniref:sugar-binding transcriptional regulator n=1 Tax=Frigoribacterium sp. 2-23 TaxID=3415006 RepID=UPI003C6FD2EA